MRVVDIVEGTSVDGGVAHSRLFRRLRAPLSGVSTTSRRGLSTRAATARWPLLAVIRYNGFDVTFTGGDPVYQAEALLPLAEAIRARAEIWCYTVSSLKR